jgi:hypothetical protein
MDIPSFGKRRRKNSAVPGYGVFVGGDSDPAGLAELLGECELLRVRAADEGVELDDSEASLAALDQLVPSWRDDPDLLPRLGTDAGLYLGTVIVRTVPGAGWQVRSDGRPVVRLAGGREIDTVELGHAWAEDGSPELSQAQAEAAED